MNCKMIRKHIEVHNSTLSKFRSMQVRALINLTIENGEELCIRVSFSFFFIFCFPRKSGTTNNHQTGLSDISH